MTNENSSYISFSTYLKSKYFHPVYKVTIDAGFICPNMDGTKALGGCTFCNNASFSPAFMVRTDDIYSQIDSNIERFRMQRKKIAQKNPFFIAYFQAFSGTYGPIDLIQSWYEKALSHPKIIGLSVSTRCDCISDEVIELFKELCSKNSEIWLEIGVESAHDTTLQSINRGHSFKEVIDVMEKLREVPSLKICLHLIHGLPSETKEMMLESVKKVNDLKPDAVKFHHLEIVKDTIMESQYKQGELTLLTEREYFEILGQSIQILDKNIIIQRLFSFSPEAYLIAPKYSSSVQQLFQQYLKENCIIQGQWSQ